MGKEERIRALTRLYYSNPKVQEAILKFSAGREVVPKYFEGFGKRPDMLQYVSDINGLVKKGATSFHASEEIWNDPLGLNAEITAREMNDLRKSWDLLIDIDSDYLDVSKVLALLILDKLEEYGIMNYGIKFSGSKGFHIIVSGEAFPSEFEGVRMPESFPEWPRAICEYLTFLTRKDFNKKIGEIFDDAGKVKERVGKEEITETLCPKCGRSARKGVLVTLRCPVCGTTIQRKDMKITKKRLKCVQDDCAGVFEIEKQKDYFQCEYCDGLSSINKMETSGRYAATFSKHAKDADYSDEMKEEFSGNFFGASDLVLVAPRHLFRMPYSLHEKTALASIVLKKEEIQNFMPRDADPMKIEIREFLIPGGNGEARRLLGEALRWKQTRKTEEEKIEGKKYSGKKFDDVKMEGVTDDMFPKPIQKLLLGLKDGRKRGLFVLLTFLRCCGFSPEEIQKRVKEWNEKNEVALKEGYVRSQIDWHLKQKRKILPPNYNNDAFWKDLGLLDSKPDVKNPLVEVGRRLRRGN
ncbi:hypothetical protein J4402_00975 [Candidatus Pacearchaeota archaeon]|nr:hypothetical protein [Candidatus Pacearchaeota archaeon]